MSIANQQEWLSSPLGDYLQAQEQSIFDEAVGDVFGFNAIQVGMLQMDLLRNSRIPFSIRTNLNPGHIPGQLLCDSVQLPFSSNSIDLLLLPHGLDFSTNPQQTLREAERVLVAEGHIMITGFNPVSSWGLKHMVGKHSNYPNNNYPWNSSFLSLLRVKDWLALLGFEMVASQMTCYSPPLSKAAWLQRFQFMDKVCGRWWPMMGGVYFIVAKKKVVGMRLIRPNWNKAKFKPSLVATPSQKGDCQKTGEGQD